MGPAVTRRPHRFSRDRSGHPDLLPHLSSWMRSNGIDGVPLERERIGKMTHFLHGSVPKQDLDNIEPDSGSRTSRLAQVAECSGRKEFAFACVHCRSWTRPLALGAGLDLGKDQAVRIPEDQINFTSTTAVVRDQKLQARRTEVLRCRLLSQCPPFEVFGPTYPAEQSSEPTHHLGKSSGSGWRKGA